MKRSRVLYLIICLLMVFALIFTSCTNDADTSDPAPDNDADSGDAGDASDDDDDMEEPMEEELEPVTIQWYMIGSGLQNDHEKVLAEVNSILGDNLNVTLDWMVFDWGSYDDKMRLKISAAEEFDICFTSHGWVTKYQENVAKGAFLPLTDLLPEYAPTYWETIPQHFWETAKINGEIYAAMNYQTLVEQRSMLILKSMVDKYDFDYMNAKLPADYEEFMQQILDNETGMSPIGVTDSRELPTEFLASVGQDTSKYIDNLSPLTINFDTTDYQFNDPYKFTDTQVAAFEQMHDWYNKGFIRKDAVTYATLEEDITAGKVAMWPTVYKPGVDIEQGNRYGLELVAVPITLPTVRTRSVLSGMNAISQTSPNPERAVMVIEEVFKNKDLYNLMAFGIEGEHYERLEGEYIRQIEDSQYWSGIAWEMCNQFNAYLIEGQPEDVWERTIEINESAFKSPISGFTLDTSPIKNEIAAYTVIEDELMGGLYTGTLDPAEYVPIFEQRAREADPDGYMLSEGQKQLDAWVEANGIK